MKEISLPSGTILRIEVAPFAVSRALYQAILEEGKAMKLDPKTEIDVNLYKDLFCSYLSSKKVEACLWECMKRCTYGGPKITDQTFEPVEARDDYLIVCLEVTKENIAPFMKSLYAKYSDILASLKSSLA